MANYQAFARSNTFVVHDTDDFCAALEHLGSIVIVIEAGNRITLFVDDPDDYGWPTENEDGTEIIYEDLIAPHLQDGQTCVRMEVGHEKLHYLCGYAHAVHSSGRSAVVSLNDIFELVRDWT